MLVPARFVNQKWVFLLLGVGVLLFSVLLFLFPSSPASVVNESCTVPSRESYSLSPVVFQNLPSFPLCFFPIVHEYQSRRFSDDFFFTPDYFLQPEFFPRFLPNGLSAWQDPSSTHYGAVGFGAFPQTKILSLKSGAVVQSRFFIHSGFGVHAYQGMRLHVSPLSPLEVKLDAPSENGFLLGPTFPIFSSAWVHPVDVTLFIPPATPPGEYLIRFTSATPTPEAKAAWSLPPALLYFDATQFVGELPVAAITVRVE